MLPDVTGVSGWSGLASSVLGGAGSMASSSATAIGGKIIFGDYPQSSPVVNTNAGDGSIDMRAATGPLASVGVAWWQWLIVGGIAWGLLRGGK